MFTLQSVQSEAPVLSSDIFIIHGVIVRASSLITPFIIAIVLAFVLAIKYIESNINLITIYSCKLAHYQHNNAVFELPGGWGLNPPTSACRPPYLWSKFDPGGVEFQPPHLRFAEVGMLLDSHFLLMQFLKYLQFDDLNVTTILIHIED